MQEDLRCKEVQSLLDLNQNFEAQKEINDKWLILGRKGKIQNDKTKRKRKLDDQSSFP